jgi:endo-1,4-beta-xylanase
VAVVVALGACSGGGEPTQVQNCTTNPSLPQCQHDTTPQTPTTLKGLAAPRGLSIGAALDANFTVTNSARYDSLVAAEFNEVTPGNFMKWEPLNRVDRYSYRWAWPDSLVSFAASHGMKVRGHTLVWHNQLPNWLANPGTAWTAATLWPVLKEHIDSVVGHYKGKLYAWDVVNEALNDGNGTMRSAIWLNTLGPTYVDTAFAEARKVDPNVLLFYNDYNIETAGPKQDSAYALVQRLKAKNLIDGIGFQAHFLVNNDLSGAPTRQQMIDTFNRFAALGVKIHLTELDVRVPNGAAQNVLDRQASLYSDVVAACRVVSACEMIVVWGVFDGESWIPGTFPGWGQALLWSGDLNGWSKKATYNAVTTALQ